MCLWGKTCPRYRQRKEGTALKDLDRMRGRSRNWACGMRSREGPACSREDIRHQYNGQEVLRLRIGRSDKAGTGHDGASGRKFRLAAHSRGHRRAERRQRIGGGTGLSRA